MKKRILAISLVLVGVGVLAFYMIRANRIIQQQRAEVDRLHRSVADLKSQVVELQKESRVLPLVGRTTQSQDGVTNRVFNAMPNATVIPFSQKLEEAPPGAVPFEFNGMTYYRTPLAVAR